jgi:N6-adenosine-specific RNA methylase IME4
MGNYGIIYTDPPWQQQKGNSRKCRPNQGKCLDYPTLPLDEIAQIHSNFFAQAAQNHNVFLWTIDKFLFDAEQMMQNAGYTVHARIVWDKCNGIAPAFTIRFAHEYLLWCYPKGKMLKPCAETRGKYTTVIREPATVHSRKPEAAYQMIEDMFPCANKIELFAREERAGWDNFGNEICNGATNKPETTNI